LRRDRHPDLIDQALRGTEPEYLLCSPLREPNSGPFGLEGPSRSHALAVTATSLIISRNRIESMSGERFLCGHFFSGK
jgi:hypothetical protein